MSVSLKGIRVEHVATISGSAGGSRGEADVVLRVVGVADTVVGMRKYVERACLNHDELVKALVDAQELLEERSPAVEWNQKGAASIAALLKRVQS